MTTPHAFDRRRLLAWMAAAGGGALAGCAAGPAPVPAAPLAAALAPQGRLRACINLGNPILARRDGDGVAGVSVDLAREFGRRLGVPVELVVVDAALKSVETVRGGGADIGFFAVDPARSQGLAFSAPYILIEGAYLVRRESPLLGNEQVDRPGTKIMVGRGSAYDLYLTRALKAATLVRTTTSQQVVADFLAQHADVAAGVKQQLEADARRLPGLRLLPGRFMVIEQAMGVQAGRGAAAEQALREFVEQMKTSGFVAQALRRHAVEGAIVAPAAG
ncbi:MAG: ABC transporter substrate-binding protein [Rubrivivax sp.]